MSMSTDRTPLSAHSSSNRDNSQPTEAETAAPPIAALIESQPHDTNNDNDDAEEDEDVSNNGGNVDNYDTDADRQQYRPINTPQSATIDQDNPLTLSPLPSTSPSSSSSSSSSSTTSSASSASSSTAISTRKMIAFYARECLCILVLIFTTYATYQNIPPKISLIMPAKPFFPKGSLVHDWPAGQLAAAQHKVQLSELSFVLFYAPWCAESQTVRQSYEYVARLFYREAHFAAINCWHPGGECRYQYGKIMNWPVLMGYMQNGVAISYNGKWKTDSIIRFVRSMLYPLQRVSAPDELLKLITSHDVVVTLFVDIHRHPQEYKAFYRTALKSIEKDPFQDVLFTMVTGKSAEQFGITQLPSVRLYLWNETLEFPNATWTQKQLTKWIENSAHQISAWLSPPGSKSNILSTYFKRGPALILFTPRNLNRGFVDAYSMMRQIGLEYFNCPNYANNNQWIRDIARNFMLEQRHQKWHEYVKQQDNCALLRRQPKPKTEIHLKMIPVSFSSTANLSNLSDNRYCFIGPRNRDDDNVCANDAYYSFEKYRPKTTSNLYTTSDDGNSDGAMDDNDKENGFKTSMLNNEKDYRSPIYLQKSFQRKNCEVMAAAGSSDKLPSVFFANDNDRPNFDMISGMACRTNRSLSFLAIDTDVYHLFAERLGVDVRRQINETVAFIIDHENESTYVLDSPISLTSLIKFINNFLSGKLTRLLKKTDSAGTIDKSPLTSTSTPTNMKRRSIEIAEISSVNLMAKLQQSNKTIIVLFYSTQCALCSLLTHHLLHVSNILVKLPNLEFLRIDGDRNDLPWHYTMEKFPMLVAFSGHAKPESRIYPQSLEVNTENVLGFVLTNLSRPLRLYGMALVCKTFRKMKPFESCINVMRHEIMDNISYSLKEWRYIAEQKRRTVILRRLQLLQRFYLHLYRINYAGDSAHLRTVDSFVKHLLNIWITV